MPPDLVHAARLFRPSRWLVPLALAACLTSPHAPGVTRAQAQGHLLSPPYPGRPEPDPLGFLQPGDPVEEKKIRLSMALLRVPAVEFAKTLKQDHEAGSLSWHRWLLQAKAVGTLKLVEQFTAQAAPHEAFKSGHQRPYNYIRQGESSQLWSRIMRENAPQLNPEIWDRMLDNLDQSPVGALATGEMALNPDQGGVEIKLHVNCAALPLKRPSPAWVHPHFPAPKLLFPTWEFQGHVLAPVSEPFLLAAQMEPLASEGAPGGPSTPTHVWALFGKLSLAADLAGKTGEGAPLETVAGAWQTWTLDVPASTMQGWLRTRQSDAHDGGWLQLCLVKGLATEKMRLHSVMSGATTLGKSSRVTENDDLTLRSVVTWNDSTGFEPTHNDRIFRPCVAEDDEFSRTYELQIHSSGMALAPGSTATWQVAQVGLSQPAAPLVWRRWKHTMEGTEQDDGNLELADATLWEAEGCSLEAQSAFPRGKVVLLSATQQGERMLATFARVTDGSPPPQIPQAPVAPSPPQAPAVRDPFGPGGGGPEEAPPQLHTTIWQIDTPLDWMQRALAWSPDQAGSLAAQLLEATKQGTATVVAMNARRQMATTASRWVATQPVNFYGGPYVNTAPHARGIYFNMRHLEQVSAGEKERLEVGVGEPSGLVTLNAGMDSFGKPAWRHWGIWQPSVIGTNAGNSGINRPAFPIGRVNLSALIPPGHPQALAVTVAPDASAPGTTGRRLRWWVIGVNIDDRPVSARPADAPAPARSSLVQAVILRLPKTEAIPSDSQALAERLLAEAAAGTRPVLDLTTLLRPGTRDIQADLTSGTDFYFTNGRTHPYTEDQAALINAPALMPPDSKYDDQINLQNRIVGSRLSVNEVTWTLTRDLDPPQVVTDTFQDVRYEFPWPEEETAKRTAVSVQRPIFHVITKKDQPLPAPGRPVVVRLTDEIVVVVRTEGS